MGWMKQQLKIQADGLNGNLDKVWRDVRDSAWIGGDAEGWERVPYWLDGFIPLAYLLEDSDMLSRAEKYIDAILERIQSDKIANIEEVMEYLTRVMRGEEKDSFDMEPSLQERTKAANALADRLDNKAKKLEINTAVTIIDDIPDDTEVEDDEED